MSYKEIKKIQGAVLKNPRWLTTLLTLGALFGRGSQRYLAGGQALMLSGSRYPGLAFTFKNGGTVYLWGSGFKGMSSYEQMDKFLEGLQKEGVAIEKRKKEIIGFGTEPRFDKIFNLKQNWIRRHPVLVLILTPFLTIAAGYLCVVLF